MPDIPDFDQIARHLHTLIAPLPRSVGGTGDRRAAPPRLERPRRSGCGCLRCRVRGPMDRKRDPKVGPLKLMADILTVQALIDRLRDLPPDLPVRCLWDDVRNWEIHRVDVFDDTVIIDCGAGDGDWDYMVDHWNEFFARPKTKERSQL